MRARTLLAAGLMLLAGSRALAESVDERLELMREPIAYTEVIDAFDGRDRFDLDVHLAYVRSHERARVVRERTLDGVRSELALADYERAHSQLALGVDVGLYRDLMAFVRLPLTLSDARSLRRAGGASEEAVASGLSDVAIAGEAAQPLFTLPLESPTRAGLDYLAFGAAYALLNQSRVATQPNWVLRIEGRRAVGKRLTACSESAAGVDCGSSSGADLDGDGQFDGTRRANLRPGSSRGMSGLALETRFSRRYRRAEPYAGFALLVEWPAERGRDYQPSRASGLGRVRPGPESTVTLGTALVPWENRAAFQRFALDVRLHATHVARGVDYGPLFDALGSSSHPELARARYEGVLGAPGRSVPACAEGVGEACGVGQRVSFDGRTERASHLRYGGQLGIELRAARYVRFALGSSLSWVTDHAVTGRAACGGDTVEGALAQGDDGQRCRGGRVDPRTRAVIDAPGRRFLLRDQLLLGVYAQATALF